MRIHKMPPKGSEKKQCNGYEVRKLTKREIQEFKKGIAETGPKRQWILSS